MNGPYGARKQAKRIGDTGRSAEKRIIASTKGARGTPASGSQRGYKGDYKDNVINALAEVKVTEQNSIGLKLSWLVKITQEALAIGRIPLLEIRFVDAQGNSRTKMGDWVCIPKDEFEDMKERLSCTS